MRSPTPAEALRNLPEGLTACPITRDDLADPTQLLRAVDIGNSGTTATNEQQCADMCGEARCQWGLGAAVIERGAAIVGSSSRSTVESGRGWAYDSYAQPGDAHEEAVNPAA